MHRDKIALQRFLLCQIIATMGLTLITGIFWGRAFAESVFFGGLLAVIPNGFLSLFLWLRPTSIYLGELLKIFLTGFLLVLLLRFFDVALAPLLIGLLGTYAVYLFAPLLLRIRSK